MNCGVAAPTVVALACELACELADEDQRPEELRVDTTGFVCAGRNFAFPRVAMPITAGARAVGIDGVALLAMRASPFTR